MGELVVYIPPLREHPENIPELVETLLVRAVVEGGVGWPLTSPSLV